MTAEDAWRNWAQGEGLGRWLEPSGAELQEGQEATLKDGTWVMPIRVRPPHQLRIRLRRPRQAQPWTAQLRVLPAARGVTIALHAEGLTDEATRTAFIARWNQALEAAPSPSLAKAATAKPHTHKASKKVAIEKATAHKASKQAATPRATANKASKQVAIAKATAHKASKQVATRRATAHKVAKQVTTTQAATRRVTTHKVAEQVATTQAPTRRATTQAPVAKRVARGASAAKTPRATSGRGARKTPRK
ncbi:hypothetical protein LZ198_15455 [Myxococcus sp. K15C18031901]|nr:hypothetical protein [Myxococcus dinghuensis]